MNNEQPVRNKKNILIAVGAVVLIIVLGVGIWYFTRSKPTEKPSETPPVDTPPVDTPPVDTPPVDTPPVDTPPVDTPPVEYTCSQCRKKYNTKDNPLVERRYCSQTCWENAKREQKEEEIKIAKGRMLDAHKSHFTEQELATLISQIPYQGFNYQTSTWEEIVDKISEIIKKKDDKPFDKFPVDTKEFKEKYEKSEGEKSAFFRVALIPRQADGKVDWIKWEEQEDKIAQKNKSLKKEEIKKIFEEKINPTLKTWSEYYEAHSDPVKRLEFLNKQILEHINVRMVASYLIKQAVENGFLGENDSTYKDGFNASYEDASGNDVETTFPLITEYDLSKLKTS